MLNFLYNGFLALTWQQVAIGLPTFLTDAVKGVIIIFAVLLQKKDSN